MSNYVQSTNFATKDNLSSGDPLKIVKGTEINTEFANIAIAVATKADLASPTFTGTPALPTGTTAVTQSSSDNSTALATTAFVQTAVTSKAASSVTISAGTGLSGGGDLTANRTLSIANTGVTATSYGGANAIPVLTINAQGQVTSASTSASYPTSYSLATSNGASTSRSVYLTAGTWQFVLDTRAYKTDDSTYSFNTTQSASITSVSGSSISTSINFYRAGGAGYGRTIHGSALAVASVTISTAGNYTLNMDAVSLNGSTSAGSRIMIEKTA